VDLVGWLQQSSFKGTSGSQRCVQKLALPNDDLGSFGKDVLKFTHLLYL
jgi:hypothetical protein